MLQDYHQEAADWRKTIRSNTHKTWFVITAFISIYVVTGLLIDIMRVLSMYPEASVSLVLKAFLKGMIVPWATLILGGIAIISWVITLAFSDKIMLLGTEYYEITETSARTFKEKQLYHVVEEMKIAAGLHFMPKVFVIDANYMNAFASGYSERSAMVAITKGLMEKLDRAELKAVMAHELSHIRHLDIKLTLTVALLGNILLLVVDMFFYSALFGRDGRREDNRFLAVIMLLRYLLPVVTVLLSLFLSRTREYMADAGSVELMRDNEPLARALIKISADHTEHAEEYEKAYQETPHEEVRQAAYLFDPSEVLPLRSLTNAFRTHPALSDRLKAIGFSKKQ